MESPATAEVQAAAARLRVDAWTAEVIRAMRDRGIRPVLLKGPAVGRWLYRRDPWERPYRDVDLIVSPADTGPARALLGELEFAALPSPPLEAHVWHALPYLRERDRANIDLHRTLHGLQDVPCEHVWQVVSTATEVIRVANLDVEIPGIPVRILHLALHLGHGDAAGTHPWRDLERAVSVAGIEDWRAAVKLARGLGVENEMAVRMRRVPDAARIADELDLTHRGSRYFRLREAIETGRAPGSAHSVWAFTMLPDTRSRLTYVRGKLFPGSEVLREQSTLARRGHTSLAGVLHIGHVLARLPSTFIGWARNYRE